MIESANLGSGTTVARRSRKRGLLASAAVALGYMVLTAVPALEPTPAAAQTFVVGGFRIHVSGMRIGGGRYYRHRSSRHADSGSRRHGRRRGGGGREEETASARAPQPVVAAPVASTAPAEVSLTSAKRPVLHGPDIEPSK